MVVYWYREFLMDHQLQDEAPLNSGMVTESELPPKKNLEYIGMNKSLSLACKLTLEKWIRYKGSKYKRKPAIFWTHEEILRMLSLTRGKAYIALGLGYFAALRVSELRSVRVSDIDFRDLSIWIDGKGGQRSQVYFYRDSTPFMVDLKRWIEGMGKDAWVIPGHQADGRISDKSLNNMVKKYSLAANLPHMDKAHFHMLRHSRATRIYEVTGNLSYSKETLRHRWQATTERTYTHLPPKNIKGQVNRFMKD